MIDHEQRNALHFGGRREAKHRLAVSVRSDPLEVPPFLRNVALVVDYLERAFVSLRH
jgi:hypothetical protein